MLGTENGAAAPAQGQEIYPPFDQASEAQVLRGLGELFGVSSEADWEIFSRAYAFYHGNGTQCPELDHANYKGGRVPITRFMYIRRTYERRVAGRVVGFSKGAAA